MTISLADIIKEINPLDIIGSPDRTVSSVVQADPDNKRDDVLMWISPKLTEVIKNINHGIIICKKLPEGHNSLSCTYLLTENPRRAFQKVLTEFFIEKRKNGISNSAIIAPDVKISEDVFIGENVVIEDNCVIGDGSSIGHNTVIKSDTIIGKNVVIGSNNTIGGVGFGYEKDENGQFVFIPHVGNVIIKDNVEIGNNTCIDRAVLGSTILEENVKVDNLVHVAHGVKIGRNSLIIANVMIAGSVEIGDNTWVAPSSSILNQKKIGNNVTIGISAVVLKDVQTGQTVIGNPAEEISLALSKRKLMNEKLFK